MGDREISKPLQKGATQIDTLSQGIEQASQLTPSPSQTTPSPSQTSPSQLNPILENVIKSDETKDTDDAVGKTLKLMEKYKYDYYGFKIGGKMGSHIQWWSVGILNSFGKCFNFIFKVITIIFAFVIISVMIGVINMALEGVHGTLSFASKLMGGLNKIAMGALSGPKRKVDAEKRKTPKNAIELFILFGIQIMTNPIPFFQQLGRIMMGIKSSL